MTFHNKIIYEVNDDDIMESVFLVSLLLLTSEFITPLLVLSVLIFYLGVFVWLFLFMFGFFNIVLHHLSFLSSFLLQDISAFFLSCSLS
jgi:hypothetical protein